jgi:hypothetical protein
VTRKRRGGVKRGPRRKEGKDTRKMNNKEVRSRLPHGRTTGKDKVMDGDVDSPERGGGDWTGGSRDGIKCVTHETTVAGLFWVSDRASS